MPAETSKCRDCGAPHQEGEGHYCPQCARNDYLNGVVLADLLDIIKARSLTAGCLEAAYGDTGVQGFDPPPRELIVKHLRAFEQDVIGRRARLTIALFVEALDHA